MSELPTRFRIASWMCKAQLILLLLMGLAVVHIILSTATPCVGNKQATVLVVPSYHSNTTAIKPTLNRNTKVPLCTAPGSPPLPTYNASSSNAQPSSSPPVYGIFACRGLELAYIHIFKSGGSSMSSVLSSFCKFATGERLVTYLSYKGQHLPSLDLVCGQGQWTCFTFYRDPIDRFLSGYHEVMKRDANKPINTSPYAALRLPTNNNSIVTLDQKLGRLSIFIKLINEKRINDPHIKPQTWFLQSTASNGHMAPIGGLMVFELSRAEVMMKRLLCGAYYSCAASASDGSDSTVATSSIKHDCDSLIKFPKHRDRQSEGYGMEQYTINRQELPVELVGEIAAVYRADYCYFGVPWPSILASSSSNSLSCNSLV